MLTKALLAVGILARLASASCISPGIDFGVLTVRSASPVHFSRLQAADSGILVGFSAESEATCLGDAELDLNGITMRLREADGAVFLHGDKSLGPSQQLYVDRTPEGQGRLGYTTGSEQPPPGAERTGFTATYEQTSMLTYLGFEGERVAWTACPEATNVYSVWLETEYTPSDCLSFSCIMIETNATQADACFYSV